LGTFDKSGVDTSDNEALEVTAPPAEGNRQHPQEQRSSGGTNQPNQPVYRTTSTLEKLITFTQNLQKELDQTQKHLGAVVNKVQQLEDDRQQFRDLHNMIEEVLDRINRLENLDTRIQYLEANRHQLQDLQQTLRKFLVALNQQTRVSLQEHDENTMNE
jgi:DNA repair ATPase RecN